MTHLILFTFDWGTNKQRRSAQSVSSYYMNTLMPVLPIPNN